MFYTELQCIIDKLMNHAQNGYPIDAMYIIIYNVDQKWRQCIVLHILCC